MDSPINVQKLEEKVFESQYVCIGVNVDPAEMFPLLTTVVAIFPALVIVFSLRKSFEEILI